MVSHGLRSAAFMALSLLISGCGQERLYPKIAVTPSVTLSQPEDALAGRVLSLNYSWEVSGEFKPPERAQKVFVHFLDAEGRIGFTDDHFAPQDVRTWRPGERHQYSRRVVLPDEPGDLKVRLGFYSAGFPYKAAVIDASTGDPSFPIVTTIRVRDNERLAEEAVAGGTGFGGWEIDGRASLRSTRWVRGRGEFTFLQQPQGTRLVVRLQTFSLWGRLDKEPLLTLRAGEISTSEAMKSEDSVVVTLDVPGDGRARIRQGSIESDVRVEPGVREVAFLVERFQALPLTKAQPPS